MQHLLPCKVSRCPPLVARRTANSSPKTASPSDANGWPVVVTHHPGIGDDLNALASATATATATAYGQPHERALRTELIRDAVGRLVEKRTASHHYRYHYDKLDQLVEAAKLKVVQAADVGADRKLSHL